MWLGLRGPDYEPHLMIPRFRSPKKNGDPPRRTALGSLGQVQTGCMDRTGSGDNQGGFVQGGWRDCMKSRKTPRRMSACVEGSHATCKRKMLATVISNLLMDLRFQTHSKTSLISRLCIGIDVAFESKKPFPWEFEDRLTPYIWGSVAPPGPSGAFQPHGSRPAPVWGGLESSSRAIVSSAGRIHKLFLLRRFAQRLWRGARSSPRPGGLPGPTLSECSSISWP